MPRRKRSTEELGEILARKAGKEPGEDITFRVRCDKRNPGRIGIINIQAGDHPPVLRKTIYPLWISEQELSDLSEKCKRVSNFFILEDEKH